LGNTPQHGVLFGNDRGGEVGNHSRPSRTDRALESRME
jgi:hypothetical protein